MGLIVGYENVTAEVSYRIRFHIEGTEFYAGGIEIDERGKQTRTPPEQILQVVRVLQAKGIIPEISRFICFPGHYSERPNEEEPLTLKRLESIAATNEPAPNFRSPVVESTCPV